MDKYLKFGIIGLFFIFSCLFVSGITFQNEHIISGILLQNSWNNLTGINLLLINANNSLTASIGNVNSSLVSGYVPYTGAISNVDLGLNDLTAHNLYASYLGSSVVGSLDIIANPWVLSGVGLRIIGNTTITGNLTLNQNLTISTLSNCAKLNTTDAGVLTCAVDMDSGGGGGATGIYWTNVNDSLIPDTNVTYNISSYNSWIRILWSNESYFNEIYRKGVALWTNITGINLYAVNSNISLSANLTSANKYSVDSNISLSAFINNVNKTQVWNRTGTNIFPISLKDNIGIGTNNPTYQFEIKNTTTTGQDVNLSSVLYINASSGRVGIGNSNPGVSLDILTNTIGVRINTNSIGMIINNTSSQSGAYFSLYGKNNALPINLVAIGADVAGRGGHFEIQDGTNVYVTIENMTGNVGIGTASPLAKLHVSGTAFLNGPKGIVDTSINAEPTFTSTGVILKALTSTPYIVAKTGTADTTSGFVVYNSNNNFIISARSDGTLTIGALTPTAGIELDVEGQAECDGAGCWTVESDVKLKENIVNLSKYSLNDVLKMQPREYDYKIKANESLSGTHSFGFVAQELKQIVPEIVYGEEGSMSIGYGGLTPILVKAIQEQQLEIELLKAELCLKDKSYSWCEGK